MDLLHHFCWAKPRNGYVDGTEFEGFNYFVGLGWDKAHNFQFMLTGAPQTHNQRTTSFYNMADIADYLQYGKKYNYNHGYLNGEEFNWRKNFYHKPIPLSTGLGTSTRLLR